MPRLTRTRHPLYAMAWAALLAGLCSVATPPVFAQATAAEATAAEAAPAPGAASASAAASAPRRHHARRTPPHAPSTSQAIDERLKLLSAELHLDQGQQQRVREVLVQEREQTLRVWSDTSVPAPIRIKSTQDVSERTASRIRALLSEDQRKLYLQPRPGDATAPGSQNAELEKYLGRAP